LLRVEQTAAKRALFVLLAVSLALRAALALAGGQRYFPDENRYLRAFILLRDVERGRPLAALDELLVTPDHTGFSAVALVAAGVQGLALRGLGWEVSRATVDATAWLPALSFGLSSLACIALVCAIATRAGASHEEALIAAFLMACSSSMAYYSRHLVPYDVSLSLALFAMWLGLRERPSGARSALVGLVAGFAFLTYNGYWLVALTATAVHALHRAPRISDVARRAALASLGFLSWPALLTLLSLARDKGLYVARLLRFSRGAATQTDFSEGWSLPWAYLWHAEHGVLLVLLLGLGAVVWLALRGCVEARCHGLLWVGAATMMYGTSVLFSNGFERIGAFGRLARTLVPFLCLAAACAGARLLARRPKALLLLCGALALQAAFNLATPLGQRFPREVARELEQRFGPLGRDASFRVAPSPEYPPPAPGARYVLVNAQYLFPAREPKPLPAGNVVYRTRHPLEFLPYQYEGYVPAERALLRATDIAIRLLDTRPE
jgi:hypothetical protein